MITLTPAQEAFVNTIQGAPFQALLIRMDMNAGTFRWTNADGDITITGTGEAAGVYTKDRADATVNPVRGGGAMSGLLSVPDEDLAFSGLFSIEGWAEKNTQLYVISGGPGTYAEEDVTKLFWGYSNDYADDINRLTLSLLESNVSDGFTGRVTIDQTFKHAPPAGSVFFWGGTYWTIERGPA